MTTSITNIKERVGPGDGVTTSFSISVPMLDVSYARVQIIDRSDETAVELDRGAGPGEFQVALANDYQSVTITLGVAAAAMFDADHDMLVYRVTPLTQPVSVPYDNELPPKTQERVYDRLVQMLQELYDRSVRGISLPIGAPTGFNGEISSLTPRRAIMVNSAGNGFELSSFDPDLNGDATAAAAAAAASAATALAAAAAALSAATPYGSVIEYYGSTAPTGYAFCLGQAISRVDNPNLFAAIGTIYGAGDGSTTFNIPNRQGVVAAGRETAATKLTAGVSGVDGATLGATGGNQNLHQHNHTATDSGHQHSFSLVSGSGGPSYTGPALYANGSNLTGGTTVNTGKANITVANAGTGSSQNVQPTIIANFIIRLG